MAKRKPISMVRKTVVSNTMDNVRDYLKEEHHNVSAESFSGHSGFIAEILTRDNPYLLKVLLNAPKSEIYMQISLLNKITLRNQPEVLRLINDTFCDTIVGRVNIENNLVTAQANIDLETYFRQLREFSGLDGMTAAMYSAAAPMFAPDKEQFKTLERVLMINLLRIEDDVEKICEGARFEDIIAERNKDDDDDDDSFDPPDIDWDSLAAMVGQKLNPEDDEDSGFSGFEENDEYENDDDDCGAVDHYETIDLGDGKTLTVPVGRRDSGEEDGEDEEEINGLVGKLTSVIRQLAEASDGDDDNDSGTDGGEDGEDAVPEDVSA